MGEDLQKMKLAESIMKRSFMYWKNKVHNRLYDDDDLIQEFKLNLFESFPKFKHLPDDQFKKVISSVFNNKARGIINWSKIRPDTSNFVSVEVTISENSADMLKSVSSKNLVEKLMDIINKSDKLIPRYKKLFFNYLNIDKEMSEKWEKMQEENPVYRQHAYPPFFTFAKMNGIHPQMINKILKRIRSMGEVKALVFGKSVKLILSDFGFKMKSFGVDCDYYSKVVGDKTVIITPVNNNSDLDEFSDEIVVYEMCENHKKFNNVFSGLLADYICESGFC